MMKRYHGYRLLPEGVVGLNKLDEEEKRKLKLTDTGNRSLRVVRESEKPPEDIVIYRSFSFLNSFSPLSIATPFSENTVRVSLKTDKIKSLFRELFIGLTSMFSSQNNEIMLICPNNMLN